MALKLAGRLFTGPFPIDTTEVRGNQSPVVYAIIAKEGPPWAPAFRVIDVGFSEDAGIRFADLSNRAAWTCESASQISVYLFYAPRSEFSLEDRQQMTRLLREVYKPPNGLVEN
jgi:hypothetical protein